MTDVHDGIQNNRPTLSSPMETTQFNYDDHWQEIEVDLERVKKFNLKKEI
jgi:hypothetical protein